MDHYKLSDEFRQKLIESAAWGKVGVETRLDEGAEVIEEKKGMKGHPDEAQDKALIKKMLKKKMMKSKMKEDADYDDEEAEELSEEVHVCPLCTSQLDESIDEERILEHLDVVMGLVERLSQLQEGEEDVEAVIDSTLAELLLVDEDETISEDTDEDQ